MHLPSATLAYWVDSSGHDVFRETSLDAAAFLYKDKKNEFVIKKQGKKKKIWFHSLILHYDEVMPLSGGYQL